MLFERRRRDFPIHRATHSRSVRRVRPDSAACPGCFARPQSSVGDEILERGEAVDQDRVVALLRLPKGFEVARRSYRDSQTRRVQVLT